MDSSKKYNHPSPEETANIFSKLFFTWILPFFKYGYIHDLQVKDLYNCAKPDLSGTLGDKLERNWKEEVRASLQDNRKPSLLRTLRQTFIKRYLVAGFILCLQATVLRMYLPIALAQYISYYETEYKNRSPSTGWALASVVILISLVSIIIIHNCEFYFQRIGMRSRIATCSLIYRKLLRLSKSSLGQVAVGKLVNLLSNDVQRFDTASLYLHYVWIMPIQTVIAFSVMYTSVGWAALAGFGTIGLQAVFLQGYLSRLQGKYRMKIAQKTDNRVRLMSEITAGIRVIKMYAWEKPFEKVIALARKYEIDIITKTSFIRGLSMALMVVTGRTASYLTLVTYVLLGDKLSADLVFSTVQLFNTVQLYMCIFFPLGLTFFAEATASIKRLEEFLLLEENPIPQPNTRNTDSETTGTVVLNGVTASWLPEQKTNILSDLNIDIKPGTLCCIVGSVGSGKSSLLQLLLKELPLKSGDMTITGTISYASQEPWLFVSSIRNNILFGQSYIKQKYRNVVKVCALEKDFEQFPQADGTLLSERGSSLSGGQRARVNLARSVYRDADIYLFDDPLSAVDAHVGKHLFNECIVKYLSNKTRILVTHQVQFLRQADLIIVLDNGQIQKTGTFAELSKEDIQVLKLEENEKQNANVEEDMEQRERLKSTTSQNSHVSSHDDDDDNESGESETEELIEKGTIPTLTYWEYYRAGGNIALLLFLVLLFITAQTSCNGSDLWLTHWTNMEQIRSNLTVEDEKVLPQNNYITIYSLFILFGIILMITRSFLFFKICMNASIQLHNTMFRNVLQATMRFFDINPSGRILNRFSKDIGTIDERLPASSIESVQVILVMSGILLMVFLVTPWMIVVAIFLSFLFYCVRRIYLLTAQDIQRLEGITKAPVFSHISASLDGLLTIRSIKAQNIVIKEFDTLQDQHTSSWFLVIATNESFGFYLDVISTIFLMVVTYQFLLFDNDSTKGGNVGLLISQSLVLTGMMQHGVRKTTDVVNHMTSVERILQYTKIDKEGPFESLPVKKPSPDWPQNGHIIFKNVDLRYIPDNPPVLRNLNMEIRPGEKVGIVGRTGAGKSSLISALFRLTKIEGIIEIDNVNTEDIGLNDLRSRISIIPQDPVLFSNSIRYNLDPFGKWDDQILWQALENVELKSAVESLEQMVQEGGSNFSVGQRQLVCLARAIVRGNKILVLDEATANVDPATDALIQTTIRKKFKQCTVLSIAHRLNTIMDSDRVVVMDAGQVVEFGHAYELLQNEKGYFSRMVKETGSALENQLRQIAEDDFSRKLKM